VNLAVQRGATMKKIQDDSGAKVLVQVGMSRQDCRERKLLLLLLARISSRHEAPLLFLLSSKLTFHPWWCVCIPQEYVDMTLNSNSRGLTLSGSLEVSRPAAAPCLLSRRTPGLRYHPSHHR
jgi:hypothetical protein